MLGQELMNVLYKGYEVPKARGRYIDRGMSFKKNEDKNEKHAVKLNRERLKPGQLMELVYEQTDSKWRSAKDLAPKINAAVESIRNALVKLHGAGRLECNNIPGMMQYRRLK